MKFWEELKLQYKIGDIGQKLIFINVVVFIISIPFFYRFKIGIFDYPEYLALSGSWKNALLFFYTFFTYMFFHAGFMHLLFNMIYLHFITRLYLTLFNDKQFLFNYIIGGIFSGIIYLLFSTLFLNYGTLVGASAAILSLLFTLVFYAPNMSVRLLLIGTVKLWHIGLFMFILDILNIGLENTGGHISHLSGVLFGFLNYLLIKNGKDLSKTFSIKKKNKYFKKVYSNKSIIINDKKEAPEISTNTITQKKIDDILDKISTSGYDSLTKEEKEFLFKQQ